MGVGGEVMVIGMTTPYQANWPSVEAVPQKEDAIAVDIFVKFDGGGPFDYAVNACLGKLAIMDTRDYGFEMMKELTDRAGGLIQEEALPAGIHIWFKLLPIDSANLPGLCENLIYHPVIDKVHVAEATSSLQSQQLNQSRRVFWPYDLPYRDIHERDLNAGIKHNSQPKNIFITLGCPAKYAYLAPTVQSVIGGHLDSGTPFWKADPLPFRLYQDHLQPKPFVWRAPAVRPGTAQFAANLLSMLILGGGKGALIWKIWRDTDRLSYLQEADYNPLADGFGPTLFYFKTEMDSSGKKEAMDQAILALKAGANSIGQADVDRAKAFAESVFLRGYGMNPFEDVSSAGPQPLFMDNLFRSYGASDPNWDAILAQIKNISLESAKENVIRLLNEFQPVGS